LLQHLDEAQQLDWLVRADVVEAVRRFAAGRVWALAAPVWIGRGDGIQGPHHAFNDIVNIGEVALVLAVIEDIYGLARQDVLGKQEQSHVGPPPRAIHREKAQAGGGQAIQMAVGMGHQFVGLFRGGVEAERMVNIVMHGKRHGGVGPIDRTAGGIHQMLHAVVAAGFQDIAEADQIGVYVGMGVLQGVTHARLRGQVDHALGLVACKQVFYACAVFQGDAGLGESGLGLEPG
jgi:hypothetical protein